MQDKIIELRGVSKIFHTEDIESHVLSGIDLDIYKGDFVSVCGPSGCGKSTLLSIIGLLDIPTSGEYKIDGVEVSQLSINEAASIRNEKVGFIFQSFNLIDELSVYDNVALPLKYRDEPLSQGEITKRVIECLEKVEMGHRINHKPNQLSGGQQQRVAIARALVANPSILLIDEPTGNLDSKNGDAVMQMLLDLNKEGTTLWMVTHDPRYANMANRQLELKDGQIVSEHTADPLSLKEVG